MRLTDLLALSHVPRWSCVDHERAQSVADHCFRVGVIVLELVDRCQIAPEIACAALRKAYTHDGAESRTADIPRPFKHALRDVGVPLSQFTSAESRMCPWIALEPEVPPTVSVLLKLADLIEAYTFIKMYGRGPTADWAACDIKTELGETLALTTDEREQMGIDNLTVWGIANCIVAEAERAPILPPLRRKE